MMGSIIFRGCKNIDLKRKMCVCVCVCVCVCRESLYILISKKPISATSIDLE